MKTQQCTKERRSPLVISEQEEKLIRACCLYQWMTILDMAYLLHLPNSLNYVRKVAARLAGNKDYEPGHYLFRFPLTQSAGGNGLRVFVPGEASRHLLRRQEDLSAGRHDADGFIWNNPAAMQGYSYSYVYHNLAATRICICAAVLCREEPSYYLSETRLAYSMARKPLRDSLTMDGKQTTVSAIPDCWLFIERVADGQGTALWFEIDNSTENRGNYTRRLQARLALVQSEAYSSYFGTAAVLLCYAVLSRTPELEAATMRMHTLARWTHEVLVQKELEHFAPLFRFAVIEYETLYGQSQTLFTKPLWLLPGPTKEDSPHVSLLPSTEPQEEPDGHNTTTPVC
jgi:hypothetical protein